MVLYIPASILLYGLLMQCMLPSKKKIQENACIILYMHYNSVIKCQNRLRAIEMCHL